MLYNFEKKMKNFIFQFFDENLLSAWFKDERPQGLSWQSALTPLTVFALVLKIAQPIGKIAPGTFKFILSLHFSKKLPDLPPTPGVG